MIKLISMRDDDFTSYIEKMISAYAQDIALSRSISEKNKYSDYAHDQITKILPKGKETENHYFYSILNDNMIIGSVWFSIQEDSLTFLHDILLDEAQRRHGYGSEVLMEIEDLARERGSHSIALHVFFLNKSAQNFYKNNSFMITGLQMFKQL